MQSKGLRVELGIDISKRGADVVLALDGDIDIHTAPQLRNQLTSLHEDGNTSIVVDLRGVNFLDSSALGALVAAHRDLTAAGGTLKLAGARTHVLKVFQITRLAEVIPLYESVDAACV